jgi:hypothetical protein
MFTVTVKCRTAIEVLFLNLVCKSNIGYSLMFIYIHIFFYWGRRGRDRSWQGELDTTLCDKVCQ